MNLVVQCKHLSVLISMIGDTYNFMALIRDIYGVDRGLLHLYYAGKILINREAGDHFG